MITLGVVDIVLLAILAALLYLSVRRRNMAFYIVVAIVALIFIERLVPGTMAALGGSIRRLDDINAGLPHLQIEPIIRIAP